MQAKKPVFEVYSSMLDNQIKYARVMLKNVLPKSATDRDVLAALFKHVPEAIKSLNLNIFAEEHFWIRTGANTIFPESAEVLENLIRARFQMDAADGFTLPFQSFMMSIPSGFKVDGTSIPSFLVSWIPYKQTEELIIGPFGVHAKIGGPLHVHLDSAPDDDIAICICYRDPITPSAYSRTVISANQIPALLQDDREDILVTDIETYKNYHQVVGISSHDIKIQRIMFRIVAALGIYNMATEGSRLSPGFPGNQQPKFNGKLPDYSMNNMTLKNSMSASSAHMPEAKDSYYRTWFFRQLRDEKYYRGEFSRYAKGSRYVFVSDTVVGQQITAHTQKLVN